MARDDPRAGDTSFAWPPRPSDAADQPMTAADPPGLEIETPRGGWWRAIERGWLGLADAPLRVRLAEERWTPGLACSRCGGSVGPSEASEADGCPACRRRRLAWRRFVRVGAYEGELARSIRAFKYTAWARLGHDLGVLLGERVAEAMAREQIEPSEAVLVPAPMDWRRRVSRGIDHAEVLARSAGRVCGAPTETWLARAWRPTQASTPRSRRRANVTGSMRATRRASRSLSRSVTRGVRVVVVVDDIRTTGATLTEACRTVRSALNAAGGVESAGVAIWAASVAVALERGRRSADAGSSPVATQAGAPA